MLLDVEKCIQDTHKILMKSLLSSNKPDEFSTERKVPADGYTTEKIKFTSTNLKEPYPNFCEKQLR